MTKKLLRHERYINGAAVLALRVAKHMTQAELATGCGLNDKGQPLSFTTISRVESGDLQPSFAIMCRIANGLEVPPAAITYVAAVYVPDEDTRPKGVVVDAEGNAA